MKYSKKILLSKNKYSIGILASNKIGFEIANILKDKFKINTIITTKKITSENYFKTFNKKNIKKFIFLDNQNLNYSENKKKLKSIKIDILINASWNKLIPKWFLDEIKILSIGGHVSPRKLELGRGQSPLSWIMINGYKTFNFFIFKINEGIDDGHLIFKKKIEILESHKISDVYKKIILEYCASIENLFKKKIILKKQNNGEGHFFPKRIPKDSEISWDNKMDKIIQFINANNYPNPLSFTEINKNKIEIIEGVKFNWKSKQKFKNGEIAKVFLDKSFLIKCNDGFILIKNWLSKKNLNISKYEGKKCLFKKNKIQLNQILKRFKKKYPNKKFSDYIKI